MVGSGTALIGLMALGVWLLWRGTLFESRRFLRLLLGAAALPFVAQAGGWLLREGGRQPWVVDGLLKTDAAGSPNVGVWAVGLSLGGYLVFYAVTFFFAGRVGLHEVREGLEGAHTEAAPTSDTPGRRSSADLALTY
jgi:cytochrome d ubiquinol oxidase subunit I